MLPIRIRRLSIPWQLLLLTIIPLLGLAAAGAFSLRTLYSEYKGFNRDVQSLRSFRGEVTAYIAFSKQLQTERNAALAFMAHREDPASLVTYRAAIAETDRGLQTTLARIALLEQSPDAALFTEKAQNVRTSVQSQLVEARTGALEKKRTAGEVFQYYMKFAYSALFISESYRGTLGTAPGLNVFDAVLALQKIQQQDMVAADLLRHGLVNGGLAKDELAVFRKQFIVSTENEYYLLKFQPELRAFFRSETRTSEDDTAFYAYLGDLAGTLRDGTAVPPFVPKTQTLPALLDRHFAAYDRVFDHGFAAGEANLLEIAAVRRRHAAFIAAALLGIIVLSLVMNLAITGSTRKQLARVSGDIEQASSDVKSASLQLTEAGTQMSQNASEFAAGIDEISSSVADVSQLAETNKQHAVRATETTGQARCAVDEGIATIGQLDAAMNSARSSAHKINQVIERINDISFQTNLLALNAAVEAARAGSAGAGFAVVADEVRQLARRCAQAADESAQLIGDAANDTATAISKSDDLANRFRNVSEGIHKVNDIVGQIGSGFARQADSMNQINQAVSRQRDVAQHVAAAAEEIASTAVSMDAQVGSLESSVQELDFMLGGNRSLADSAVHSIASEKEQESPIEALPRS